MRVDQIEGGKERREEEDRRGFGLPIDFPFPMFNARHSFSISVAIRLRYERTNLSKGHVTADEHSKDNIRTTSSQSSRSYRVIERCELFDCWLR